MEKTNTSSQRPQRGAPSQAQQSEAYDHGYRSVSIKRGVGGALGAYVNPYDSDKFWLLFLAYEQGWNDGVRAEKSNG